MKIIHFLGKKLNFYIISTTFVVSYYSASAQDIPYVKMDVEKGVIKYEVNGTKILTESNEIPAPKILSEITKTLPISENEKILAVIFCNKIDLSIITTITLIAQKAGHDKTRLFTFNRAGNHVIEVTYGEIFTTHYGKQGLLSITKYEN